MWSLLGKVWKFTMMGWKEGCSMMERGSSMVSMTSMNFSKETKVCFTPAQRNQTLK